MTEEQLRNFRRSRLQEMLPESYWTVRGNCYFASEALYHLLGGADSGWTPMNMRVGKEQHWFLKHKDTGVILDPTAVQFVEPLDYTKAQGRGFQTRMPSDRARRLMDKILWQRVKRP